MDEIGMQIRDDFELRNLGDSSEGPEEWLWLWLGVGLGRGFPAIWDGLAGSVKLSTMAHIEKPKANNCAAHVAARSVSLGEVRPSCSDWGCAELEPVLWAVLGPPFWAVGTAPGF